MRKIDEIDFVGQDERVRKFLLPRRVLETGGEVSKKENLLLNKSMQIGFSQAKLTCLQNKPGQEHAWILLDFGIEFHGGIRILTSGVQAEGGLKVRLTFGESYGEAMGTLGEKNACNDHSPRDFEVLLPQWSDLEFGQTGFRFVKLELLNETAVWNLKTVTGVFVYRELDYLGSFECSDKLINEIYETSAYTCHLNMQTMLWDGIKRDRLVWVGDTHPEMLTIRSLFGFHPIVEENLRFSLEEAPLPGWMNKMPSYSLWWLILLEDWCFSTGDFSLEKEVQAYAEGLLNQLLGCVSEDGSFELPDYFLDWNTRGRPEAKAGVGALFIMALRAGTALCERFEKSDLACRCKEAQEKISKALPKAGDRTESNALLLYAGVGNAEQELSCILKNREDGLSTLLSYYILTALSENGKTEDALEMMKRYYGSMLSLGATTFWENFHPEWAKNAVPLDEKPGEGQTDVHGDFGEHCYKGFRHSLCHGWASGPVPFLAEQVLGISFTEAGGKSIRLTPHLGGLSYAKGTYPTKYGILEVSYHMDRGQTVLDRLVVPDGCSVTLSEEVFFHPTGQP